MSNSYFVDSYFVDLFDEIYGKRHFSVETIVRSCIFSIIGVVIAFIVCSLFKQNYLVKPSNEHFEVYRIYLLLLIGNLFADYASLIQTRFILRLASRLRMVFLFPLLVADLFMSLVCYIFIAFGHYILSIIAIGDGNLLDITAAEILEAFMFLITAIMFTVGGDGIISAPFFYSTFFTSVLFYLFILASMLIRLLLVARIPILPVLRWFSSTKNPIKALVGICAAIVLIIEGIKRLVG